MFVFLGAVKTPDRSWWRWVNSCRCSPSRCLRCLWAHAHARTHCDRLFRKLRHAELACARAHTDFTCSSLAITSNIIFNKCRYEFGSGSVFSSAVLVNSRMVGHNVHYCPQHMTRLLGPLHLPAIAASLHAHMVNIVILRLIIFHVGLQMTSS